jgi:hypothetical protein
VSGNTLNITGDKSNKVPGKTVPPRASTVARPAFIPICGLEGVSPLVIFPFIHLLIVPTAVR